MEQIVFLGGMGRSGTNLLRSMLDCHPLIASGPEFNLIENTIDLYRSLQRERELGRISVYVNESGLMDSFRRLIQSYLEGYAAKKQKPIIVEKTPSNIWSFDVLAELFPESKFIHVVRDGRDVMCSHLEVGRRFLDRGLTLDSRRDSALLSPFHCGALWTETIKRGLSLCGPSSNLFGTGRAMSIRYRDLVFDSDTTMKLLSDFLDIDFEPAMLHPERYEHDVVVDNLWVTPEKYFRPVSGSSIGRWRWETNLRDRVLFAIKGQEGLELAGYERDCLWIFDGMDISGAEAREQVDRVLAEIPELAAVST